MYFDNEMSDKYRRKYYSICLEKKREFKEKETCMKLRTWRKKN
jgi:hypothetical protein